MNTFLLFGQMFGMEAILIFFVILLLFGGKKIPELMRGFGKGVGEFNKARQNVTEEFKQGLKEAEKEKIKIEDKAS